MSRSKIVSDENGLMIKDNFKVGATWAYEVGSQSMVCPIIIEDLSPPRQMFVEMLYEKRGLFLEIADIVRGLGLTILKGVMEARNDKIWARFTVEMCALHMKEDSISTFQRFRKLFMQSTVAYVNITCYYLIGIPIGVVLGYVLQLQVKVWVIQEFVELGNKAKVVASEALDAEAALGEILDEFLDPIQYTLMQDPVILPSSRIAVDPPVI